MSVNTKLLPVNVHYIANDYSLSILSIIIRKVLVLTGMYIVVQSYIQSHSCSLSNLSSAFLVGFPNLHLILYARVPNSLFNGTLPVSIFLIAISSLISGHLIFRSSSLHLCVSGHFKNKYDSLCSPAHRTQLAIFFK